MSIEEKNALYWFLFWEAILTPAASNFDIDRMKIQTTKKAYFISICKIIDVIM